MSDQLSFLLVLVVVLLEAVLLHAVVVGGDEGAHLTFPEKQGKVDPPGLVDCPSRQTPALSCWLFSFCTRKGSRYG
jgi:hypothetical protein